MDRKNEYTASALRICVDEVIYDKKEIRGRICGVAVENEVEFGGSSELFVLIDRLLDGIGRPQASRKSRSFREKVEESSSSYCVTPRIYHTSEEIRKQKGSIMTKDVFFVSRLRSSWQGMMKDSEGRVIGEFDSELGFITLLYDHSVTG